MTNNHNGGASEAPGVTIREFAESMRVAYQTVQRWINPGGMPVLGWLEIGGRRFVRLDPVRCREWALANRPALAGVGSGGWRPGSGRPKRGAGTKGRGTASQAPRRMSSRTSSQPDPRSASRADGVTGRFVLNTAADASLPSHQPPSTAPSTSLPPPTPAPLSPPPNPYLEAKTAAMIAEARVKELKYQQLAGTVLEKADVVRAWKEFVQYFAAQVALIAPAAAREVACILDLDHESRVLVERAIEEQVSRVRATLADPGQPPSDWGGAAAAPNAAAPVSPIDPAGPADPFVPGSAAG